MSAAPLAWTLVGVTLDELFRHLRARVRAHAADRAAFAEQMDAIARITPRRLTDVNDIDWNDPKIIERSELLLEDLGLTRPPRMRPVDDFIIDLRDGAR